MGGSNPLRGTREIPVSEKEVTKMATPAKKTAVAKSKGFTVEMPLARTTKNTYRFEAEEDDAPISTLYINQSAFTKEPSSVTVVVTPS